MQLPKIDGYQTTRILKKMNPLLPIIAQTAYAMTDDHDKCLDAGCNRYLSKPINSQQLFTYLKYFFER